MKLQQTSYVSGQRLKKDFSQVENAVYFTSQAIVVLQDGQPSTVPGALFVDGNLFDVLPVPFVRGDPAHALDDPHSLVLSEKAATKYFGNDDPIGRSEERRVGKTCVSTCSSRWSPAYEHKKITQVSNPARYDKIPQHP